MKKYKTNLKKFMHYVKKGNIPKYFPKLPSIFEDMGAHSVNWECRHKLTTDYGMWAIVDQRWTKRLADHLKEMTALEVCAGAGWLAKALRDYDVNVIATDKEPLKTVTTVIEMDAVEAVKHYKGQYDILILSWPMYQNPMAAETIDVLDSDIPIIYIGEAQGGCCATDEFFEKIDMEEGWNIPQWNGIHDELFFCKKIVEVKNERSN